MLDFIIDRGHSFCIRSHLSSTSHAQLHICNGLLHYIRASSKKSFTYLQLPVLCDSRYCAKLAIPSDLQILCSRLSLRSYPPICLKIDVNQVLYVLRPLRTQQRTYCNKNSRGTASRLRLSSCWSFSHISNYWPASKLNLLDTSMATRGGSSITSQ